MNWKLRYEPNSAITLKLARTIDPIRRMPSRINGWRTFFSAMTKPASSATAAAIEPIVTGVEPAPGRRQDDGVHGEQHAGRQRHRAGDVVTALGGRAVPREQGQAGDQGRDRQRHRDEER